MKSEIRKSYFLDESVIITPSRQKRPRDFKKKIITKQSPNCPFCSNNIDKNNIVDRINKKGSKDWQVLSINNIFPAVTLDNKKSYGAQEVILDTQKHGIGVAQLSKKEIESVLMMYAKRTKEISKNKKINYILCFKNEGLEAGASLAHPHSQIFATKTVSANLKKEEKLASKYIKEKGICPYCDIIKKEMKTQRKVFEDKNVAVFTPYASKYHYEVWIFPKRHVDNITLLNKKEISSMAIALKNIFVKLDNLNISFNYFLHNVISNKDQHLYIKVQPRDSIWAGVELGSGLVINSISPEKAAKYYRS